LNLEGDLPVGYYYVLSIAANFIATTPVSHPGSDFVVNRLLKLMIGRGKEKDRKQLLERKQEPAGFTLKRLRTSRMY
jgi:hypothetical protein